MQTSGDGPLTRCQKELGVVQPRFDSKLVRGNPEEGFKSSNEVEWRDADVSRDVLDGWRRFVRFAQEFRGRGRDG